MPLPLTTQIYAFLVKYLPEIVICFLSHKLRRSHRALPPLFSEANFLRLQLLPSV